ncbi:g713 [Coccomyxa viridis]|uniref:G713 protein n=1 Tax=Coccomyxa viridis TaxID=1274662 RepID=A0ABP1FGD4_9CHLO
MVVAEAPPMPGNVSAVHSGVRIDTNGSHADGKSPNNKQEFMRVYEVLREELMADDLIAGQPSFSAEYMKKMLDYNVPGGKLNRGMAVGDILLHLTKDASKQQLFEANILGWCIEWLQAFFLVADDIMDNSITRRGQPCWYRVPEVGLVACNDYIILESCIYRILKKHFAGKSYYPLLLDFFHETTHQTAHGQLLDITTAPIGTVDLSKYTEDTYMRIVTYKTAFYSFYLPVVCGLLVGGTTFQDAFAVAKDICIEMGRYFQIQDDYLDCYGDPAVIGKVGTDIQDNKCSWLIVQALQKASPSQLAVIKEHYGKDDESSIAAVKQTYRELDVEAMFKQYEQESYERLSKLISQQKFLPEEVFTALLKKIYKRQK